MTDVAKAVEAMKAKFNPTLMDGKRVKVTGIITKKFVPEQK